MKHLNTYAAVLCALCVLCGRSQSADWPSWGRTPDRNMIAPDTNLVSEWSPGKKKEGTEEFDLSTSKNVKWIAKPVLRHRLVVNFAAESEGVTADAIVDQLLKTTPSQEDELTRDARFQKIFAS